MARKRDDTANQPQWKSGWTMANGYFHEGFWYVRHKRKLVSLARYGAPSRKGGKRERNLALTARDKFLTEQAARDQATSQTNGTPAVADVLNYYAANYIPTQAPSTQRLSQHYLELFATGSDAGLKGVSVYDGLGRLPAEELTEGHLLTWKQAHPKWVDDKPVKTIKAAFAYAVRKGLIRFNPIKGAETTTTEGHAGDEEFFFSDQEEAIFRGNIQNPNFRLFFSACIETGARPGELAALQPRHIKEVDGKIFWRLEWDEWKNGRKTKKPRIIALPGKWQTWSRQRRGKSPGFLFETLRGTKWSDDAWADNFDRTLAHAIEEGAKREPQTIINPSLTMYAARHTWIYRRVKDRKPPAFIAKAAGTSIRQIEKVYDKCFGDYDVISSVLE
jgi:integrase